ncbi:MFS general substrate transporter [Mollisia scopiformis]|uniref:MFS general substrate transporter n=1 Tax=Mollisia scopiformis TaxID=149040 RepID=A0A194XIW4_MOLSC|nr:MFS general substrate transporter [Mollisia scopiformis]KUJ20103.1 MFS general substrate transporter [Mollisia scopiformis]
MAEHDVERDVLTATEPAVEDIQQQTSEETSLLSTSKKIDYQSTDVSSGDSSTLENETPQQPRSPIGIIALLLIGVLIAHADSMLVLATYGTIASEFGALKDAAWLTTSFSLAGCSTQPIMGKLSDIYGRKAVLLISYVLFAVGCVVCGIAESMPQVILGRVISGFGSAGMTVLVSIILTDLVPLIQVASWRSFVNVVATLGRSIGGPLGGLLADTIGWRWSFTGQGPLLIVAIVLVAIKLPSFAPSVEEQPKGKPSKLRRIDFVGAVLLAATIVSLLGALSVGGQSVPWGHPLVLGLLIGSVVLGTIFVVYEEKYAFEPIFPPCLVIQRDVATSYLIQALQAAAQISMMYSVPLYFRATQLTTNTVAGAHLFPAVVGNTIGGLLSGYIIRKSGRYRLLTIFASLASSLSYLLLILRWHGHTSWLESLYIVPGGFGTGIVFSSTMISMVAGVRKEQMAVATGGLYLSGSIGMMVGVAGSSAVQLGTLRPLLERGLDGVEGGKRILEEVMENVGSIKGLEEGVRRVVVEAYVKSLEYDHMVSLGCTLIALLLAFSMREHPLK